MYEIAEEIKNIGEEDDVYVSEQNMELQTGGKAIIGIGNSAKKSLPFLGELREMIRIYDEELEKVKGFKEALIKYLNDSEELSEFPWIKFLFDKYGFEVKFIFGYGDTGNCLIQHFSSNLQSNAGRERMDIVTKYIIKVKEHIGQ